MFHFVRVFSSIENHLREIELESGTSLEKLRNFDAHRTHGTGISYLHEWWILMVNVGKYPISMNPMGWVELFHFQATNRQYFRLSTGAAVVLIERGKLLVILCLTRIAASQNRALMPGSIMFL